MAMLRILCVVVLLATSSGCKVAVSDFQRGYNEGVSVIRHGRAQGGFEAFCFTGGAQVMVAIDTIPTDKGKTADWNAGFRQGFKDELAR